MLARTDRVRVPRVRTIPSRTPRTTAITRVGMAAALVAVLAAGCSGAGDGSTASSDVRADDAPAAEAVAGSDPGSTTAEGSAARTDARSAGDGTAGAGAPAGSIASRILLVQRSIVYRVDLEVRVDDVAAAAARAQQLTVAAGGFVADEQTTVDPRDESRTTSLLVLRVPVDEHERVVDELQRQGDVLARNRSAQDVTEELVDLRSRIDSARTSLDRIRRLFSLAADVSEILRLEAELAQRQADLESLLQRREQLSGLAALATVGVTFTPPPSQPSEPPAEEDNLGFLAGLRGGWDAFVEATLVVTTVVGALLPFTVAALLVGVPAMIAWRERRRRRPPVVGTPSVGS